MAFNFSDYWNLIRGGYGGGTSAFHGDIPGAIKGAAKIGQGISSIAGYPGVAQGFGSVAAPISFATGLANGDPLSSTIGGLQTASLASGYFGGPTIGSLAEGAYTALGGIVTGGAATASAAAMSAAAAPFALMAAGGLHAAISGGGDMFDSMFGTDRTQPVKQMEEYKNYAEDFPMLAARKTAGASLFDHFGSFDTPDSITGGLRTAASGLHANTEPAAWNLSHTPTALPKLKPMDLSSWDAVSPELGGFSSGAYLGLLDKARNKGLSIGGNVGDWNLNPAESAWMGETGGDDANPEMINLTDADYQTKIGYNNQAQFDADNNWIGGARGQTQEAQDLGNAVSGIGRHLGVNFDRGGADYQNFDPEQLAGYGMTPGNYGPAVLNYLRSLDPNVVNSPMWGKYTSALGDPSGLDPLNIRPRAPMTYRDLSLSVDQSNIGGM